MKQTITKIKVRDLFNGYVDNAEEGVKAFNGRLDIRPPYQREFVYKDKQRDAVINTINKNAFLGVLTWVKNIEIVDGEEKITYEVLDGQQRTLSICQYLNGDYSINDKAIYNLFENEQNKILDYEILVNIVEGNDEEKLDWFRTINISGESLTEQELRNAVYVGTWLADAKIKFSKINCVAYKLADKFVKGSPIRQDYLQTALSWISNDNIEKYMSEHQHDKNANELWLYFSNVIEWVKTTFNTNKYYRKEMFGINWGELYEKYHFNSYDADELEKSIAELMANEEVTDKKGIYEYVLSGKNEELARKLSKRAFTEKDKRTAYERQKHICPLSGKELPYEEMEGDHIIPWWMGGTTTLDNLQMVWKHANRLKGGKI